MCVQSLSHFWLYVAPWSVARQALVPLEFSRQEYQSGLPFPATPGGLPDPGIRIMSLVPPELAGRFFSTWSHIESCIHFLGLPIAKTYKMQQKCIVSGDYKSKIRFWQGYVPPKTCKGESFLISLVVSWQSLMFLGLQLSDSNLCLQHHMAFSPCLCLYMTIFL